MRYIGMVNTNGLFAAFVLFCVSCQVTWAQTDWPQLRGPQRDGVSQDTGLLKSWPKKGPKVLWRIPLGEGFSSVSVSGNRAYTMYAKGKDEFVVCVNALTGKEVWRFRSDAKLLESQGGNGPRSTPTVYGHQVFALSAFGRLYALDAETGQMQWQTDFQLVFKSKPLQWGFSTSPLVVDSLLIVEVGGRPGYNLAAFHVETGRVVWTNHSDRAAYSSPILVNMFGESQVIHFSATQLISISPDIGLPYWRYRWETPYNVHATVPIFIPPNQVYLSSGNGIGAALLQVERKGERRRVEQVWKNEKMENYISTSVITGGHIYGFHNSILKCIDVATGKERWKKRGFGAGNLIVADGHLIILGDKGKLGLVEVAPEAYTEKSTAKVLKGRCWTAPALANGKLYIRNEKELVCLDLVK